MPRMSEHRGKHKSTPYFHHLKGNSHLKNCIVAAIDEHDQMLLKICGLGRESIQAFVSKNEFESDVISWGAYVSLNGNTVSPVNELHTEAKNLIRQKHGSSTRHLQRYR